MSLIKRKLVAVTTEETSPGVPFWGPNQNITVMKPTDTEVAIENLVAGRKYYVKVWTEDMFGNASPTVERIINVPPDSTIPAVPSGLVLTAVAFGFKATWTANTETDLSEYELDYAPDDGSGTGPGTNNPTYTVVKSKTTHLAVQAPVGQLQWIRLRAIDFSGNASAFTTLASVTPFQVAPISFSANGYLDSGSPMRAYVKVPSLVRSVSEVIVSLAFRQFMAPATAATATGTLTSAGGGGTTATSASGGGSTSGDPGGIPTGSGSAHTHVVATWVSDTPGVYTKRKYSGFNTDNFNLEADNQNSKFSSSESVHFHTLPGHTHTTPNHTHDTTLANHTHDLAGHSHSLTYGTFEESYPVSHSVTVKVYERVAAVWTLRSTTTTITADQADLTLTSVITGAGDWRIEVISEAAQPNGGRLGCDLYGSITAIL